MSGIAQIADSIISAVQMPAEQAARQTTVRQKPFVIAIDGPCASGKSTLADHLKQRLDCPVIRMDHFFLPAGLRSSARLNEPGGNIHYERFVTEAVAGLLSGKTFSYQVFDCSSMNFGSTVTVPLSPVVIIEGSYSLRPEWRRIIDLAVFLRTDRKTQRQRILERSNSSVLKIFEEKWIPLENRYFAAFKICESADLVYLSN
jgi:uridine kinase